VASGQQGRAVAERKRSEEVRQSAALGAVDKSKQNSIWGAVINERARAGIKLETVRLKVPSSLIKMLRQNHRNIISEIITSRSL
jgi:hypothetical protein